MVHLPHWPKRVNKTIPIDQYNLAQIYLEKLGNPHINIPPVVHIAGTNGKGSTAMYIYNILKSAGYKVHVLVSPHILHYNERILIANKVISDNALFNYLEKVRLIKCPYTDSVTLFTASVIVAFLAFAETQADFTIIETGIGGLLDPTNVITKNLLSIITSISMDHQECLGNEILAIATHKSYILKKSPCIIAKQEYSEVLQCIEDRAIAIGASVYRYSKEWTIYRENNLIIFEELINKYKIKLTQSNFMLGNHQISNLGNAIAAISIIAKSYDIFLEDIQKGVSNAYWPARLEYIDNALISKFILNNKKWNLYIDSAHNEHAAYIVSEWIKSQRGDFHLIIGSTKGKMIDNFLKNFIGSVQTFNFVCVNSEYLSFTTGELEFSAMRVGIANYYKYDNLYDAMQGITNKYREGTIVICGSIYLYKDLKEIISN